MSKRVTRRRREVGSAPKRGRRPTAVVPRRVGRTSGTASPGDRLARLLESPDLAPLVPRLAPETIHQIIQHRGLDACGALLAALSPQQLASVLDADLWRPAQPGRDEAFDTDRFGEWLEVLIDNGGASAARTVASIDPGVVTVGLSRYIRVFDQAVFTPSAPSDDESGHDPAVDVAVVEVGGYVVHARRPDAWDAVVTLLQDLEVADAPYFHAVMAGCRRLSDSAPELDGCDELLTSPEQVLHDVRMEREGRRSAQGYATAADARAFLRMARDRRRDTSAVGEKANPISAAYFRAVDEAIEQATPALEGPQRSRDSQALPAGDVNDGVLDLLAAIGAPTGRPRALLQGDTQETTPTLRITALMERVRDIDESVYLARHRELAFLANTLLAGCSIRTRPFTPGESMEAAISICNLGIEHSPVDVDEAFLAAHDLIRVFEDGWNVLHRDVSMFAAAALAETLRDIQCADVQVDEELQGLRRDLLRYYEQGTPWQVRDALDAIAIIDTPAWVALLGVLDECPVIPAALTAIVQGQTRAVSATAFAFISSSEQIGLVRKFLSRLPELLTS